MKYFKILQDTLFIGVVHSGQFVAENSMNKLRYADEVRGQYISYNDKLYRSPWMAPTTTPRVYEEATIEEISEEEYNTIRAAIDNDEPIIDDDDEEEEEPIEPIIDPEVDATLEFIRAAKLKEMSAACRHTIEAGFDLVIRGETKHFSLTTQD